MLPIGFLDELLEFHFQPIRLQDNIYQVLDGPDQLRFLSQHPIRPLDELRFNLVLREMRTCTGLVLFVLAAALPNYPSIFVV